MSHLGTTNSSLNVTNLRELARKDLKNVLDSVRGKKCLVLDPNISGPLSLIAEFSLLRDHGVEKMHYLQPGPLETDLRSLIYICRPQLHYMKYIAEHIQHHQNEFLDNPHAQKYEYTLFFVPRRTMICEKILEEAGVFGEITINEYHLDLIPFEDDLLSLELDNTFKELYLDGDYTSIYYVARALMKLQSSFGLFPRIIGKGDCAKQLADMLIRMRREVAVDDPSPLSISQSVDSLIIIDRSVDLITPLCTQLTYEGLIDEVFGIKTSHVEVDSSIVGVSSSATATNTSTPSQSQPPIQPQAKKKKISLNSGDKLFSQLRDMNFAVVGGVLNRVAKRINENYEERHQAVTVAQIREFTNKLGGLQLEHNSLRIHTGIAEEIMAYTVTPEFNRALEVQQNLVAGIDVNTQNEYIEEMINRQAPITQVLRLLCLQSLVNGGLKQKFFEFFKKEILQTYGFEHLQTLLNLERVNMFSKQLSTRNPYAYIRKTLRLIVDEVDEQNPQDVAYVYSGYAPLSVRLIQCATTKSAPSSTGNGWKGYEEVLRMLPGKTFDEVQRQEEGAIRPKRMIQGQHPRVTLVFFLGGCTYTEISAIRFLAQQDDGQREYVIATTQIINGNSLLNPLMQKMDHSMAAAGGNSA